MSTLQELINDLSFAAGAGVSKLASAVTASGRVEAATGFESSDVPGPALQSVLDRHSGQATSHTDGNAASAGTVAGHMADNAANRAVRLLMGT